MIWKTFKLHKSPPGEISKQGCWCLWDFSGPYLYTGDNFWQLLKYVFKNWKDERQLVG